VKFEVEMKCGFSIFKVKIRLIRHVSSSHGHLNRIRHQWLKATRMLQAKLELAEN